MALRDNPVTESGEGEWDGVIEDIKEELPEALIVAAEFEAGIHETETAVEVDWKPLRYVATQQAFYRSENRFNICHPGRRWGKTELAIRRHIQAFNAYDGEEGEAWFIIGAPTWAQARRIYWNKLKRMQPRQLLASSPSNGALMMHHTNGAILALMGMDEPARVEGIPIKRILLDEYGNMHPEVWTEHVRAALADLKGTADFIGVPEGMNHYKELVDKAIELPDWDVFSGSSREVLPHDEIVSMLSTMDARTAQQEIDGQFVAYAGLVYYQWCAEHEAKLDYDPNAALIFCFDFNVSPGVAVVCQERDGFTAAIGEVWIEDNSNTIRVCRKLIEDWGHHTGLVKCYGDASGGARGSAKILGSDWALIRQELKKQWPRVQFKVPKANPKERARVNALNARMRDGNGQIRFRLDPHKCKHLKRDFEAVRWSDTGEIDKKGKGMKMYTHLTDALGYYIHRKFPTSVGHLYRAEAA